ncbi:MAG: hypothetical protein IT461_09505 [Planctomycetes bacterium]|nr:hypothetical protein [Planctomycetota bacterium]
MSKRDDELMDKLNPVARAVADELIGMLGLPEDLLRRQRGTTQIVNQGVLFTYDIRHRARFGGYRGKRPLQSFALVEVLVGLDGSVISSRYCFDTNLPNLVSTIRHTTGWNTGEEPQKTGRKAQLD